LDLAMQEFSRSHPDLWEMLLPERRRSLILTLESMVLHSVRCAPIIEENSDDERRLHNGAPQLAALLHQAREDSQPPP
jgi:hypothetical protein